jgi:hypothetical protein
MDGCFYSLPVAVRDKAALIRVVNLWEEFFGKHIQRMEGTGCMVHAY